MIIHFRKRSGNCYIVESTSDKKQLLENENIDEKSLLSHGNPESYLTYSFTEETKKPIPNRYSFQIVEPLFDGKDKSSGETKDQNLTIREKWRNSKLRKLLG